MAIVRCAEHRPEGRTRTCVACVEPVGHPDTAMVCGSAICDAAGLIWLEAAEAEAFAQGQRVFRSFTATMKRRAKQDAQLRGVG